MNDRQRQQIRDLIARTRLEQQRREQREASRLARIAKAETTDRPRVRDLNRAEKRVFFRLLAACGDGHLVDAHEHCARVAREVVRARERFALLAEMTTTAGTGDSLDGLQPVPAGGDGR